MYKIAICIPTYRRPLLLEKLLQSIFESKIDESLIREVQIIIVDNDVDRTGEAITLKLKGEAKLPYTLNYFNYPVKGLSYVRNELLRQALLFEPDFIDFVDDDEFVSPEWLIELLKTIIGCNADAVRGPVLAVKNHEIPQYIWSCFKRESYPACHELNRFTTGNLLLRRTSFQKYETWFDNRFNGTGSEDSFFGVQMIKKGARIFWADMAVAYEIIPESRTTVRWLMKRSFRGAANYVYILKLEKQYFKIGKKVVVSVFNLLIGAGAFLVILIPINKRLWGILKISEGIGGIAGLTNFRSDGY